MRKSQHLQDGYGPRTSGALESGSDREVVTLEKHGVYELIPITSVPTGQRVIGTRWVNKKKQMARTKAV